jgi:hypothetical protein
VAKTQSMLIMFSENAMTTRLLEDQADMVWHTGHTHVAGMTRVLHNLA